MFEISHQSGITTLLMSHRKVNAMDLEFCRGLISQLQQAAADEGCSAVVVTGRGRVFSAGVDLKRLIHEGPDYLEEFLPALIGAFDSIFRFPKPVVAAINGHAVAGGCILAAACDYRIIGPTAKIGIPELRVGVPLPTVAIEIMRLVAAPSHFQRLVNLGATCSGAAALAVGLADEMADLDLLQGRAFEKALQLSAIPPDVFRLTKRQIRQPASARIAAGDCLFQEEIFRIWRSAETRQVIRDYVEKRL
jgi:enoyl-CoA hydratase